MSAAPLKVESPGCQSEAFANHSHNVVNFATVPGSGKALATLKARFASAGHQVHVGGNDDFIVTRWGMSRYCENPAALRRFALVLGVTL